MSVAKVVKSWLRTTETVTNITVGSSTFFARGGRTGVDVSRSRSMQLATAYGCVKARAETIASTPVGVVGHRGNIRERRPDPVWLAKPNDECTRFELFEKTSASIDVDGNAFWYVVRNNMRRVVEVWPLPPTVVDVRRAERTQTNPYPPVEYWIDNEKMAPGEILHIRGFSVEGRLRGQSPIAQNMHTFALAIAAEEMGETFFGNGAVLSGIIEYPGADPGETAANRLRQQFANDHQGVHRAHLPGFFFGGATWKPMAIPNDQAQFLETRKFQRDEICAIFRVPPHKVGNLERATFSNIEHQGIEWVTDGLVPPASRIEHAIKAFPGMLGDDEQLRFNFAGQLRGDILSRYQAYAIGRNWGWLSADDIREKEDENPLPDGQGQTYLEPLNMRDASDPASTEAVNAIRALVGGQPT